MMYGFDTLSHSSLQPRDQVVVVLSEAVWSIGYRRVIANIDIFAATLYIWDLLLTTHLDVELVWSSEKLTSTITILYLLQRYLPLISTVTALLHEDLGVNMTVKRCGFLGKLGAYSILAGFIAGEAVLTIRTWSAWHRSKKMGVFLIITFTALWTAMFVVLHLLINSVKILPSPGPYATGCFVDTSPGDIMMPFWTIFLGWTTLLLTLLLIQAVENGQLQDRALFYNSVFRKGTIYYFCICAMLLLSLIGDSILPPHLMPLFRGLQPCLHSMLTSKAFLAIRLEGRSQWQAHLDSGCLRSDTVDLAPQPNEQTPELTESVLRDTCTRLERDLCKESGIKVEMDSKKIEVV